MTLCFERLKHEILLVNPKPGVGQLGRGVVNSKLEDSGIRPPPPPGGGKWGQWVMPSIRPSLPSSFPGWLRGGSNRALSAPHPLKRWETATCENHNSIDQPQYPTKTCSKRHAIYPFAQCTSCLPPQSPTFSQKMLPINHFVFAKTVLPQPSAYPPMTSSPCPSPA